MLLGFGHSALKPNNSEADVRIKTFLQPGLANPQVPAPPKVRLETGARRLKLAKKDFAQFGLTIGCAGCKQLTRASGSAVNHSENCRSRIEAELAKTAEGKARLEAVEQRLTEAVVEVVEREDEKSRREREEACPPTKVRKVDQTIRRKGRKDAQQI